MQFAGGGDHGPLLASRGVVGQGFSENMSLLSALGTTPARLRIERLKLEPRQQLTAGMNIDPVWPCRIARPSASLPAAGGALALGEGFAGVVDRALLHPGGDVGKGDGLVASVAALADETGQTGRCIEAALENTAAMGAKQFQNAHRQSSPVKCCPTHYTKLIRGEILSIVTICLPVLLLTTAR